MKFLVGDRVFDIYTMNEGEIKQVHYILEYLDKQCNDATAYEIEWDDKTRSWREEDSIAHVNESLNPPLDLMLIDILINRSLDEKNEDDFRHYVKLKKELLTGELGEIID